MKTIIVYYPHNPFKPCHGSHLRCLQQLQDLRTSYRIILASSSEFSSNPFPSKYSELRKIAHKELIFKIVIFELSIPGVAYRLCMVPLRILKRLVPHISIIKVASFLQQAFHLIWLSSLALRYQPCATIVHYTYWAYMSRVLAGGVKILELHDLLPITHYLTQKISNLLQANSSLDANKLSAPVKYVDNLSQLPPDVVAEIHKIVVHINRFDLAWMISHREVRLLKEFGITTKLEVIYPMMTCETPCKTRANSAILPVGPNAFNTYSLQNFIKEVIPLLDPQALRANEIQVTGRFWCDQTTPMPHPLKYYGVVDDYSERLSRSAFMVAPTSVGTGQQIKIFEALASGIPVICYRSAVPPDILVVNPSIIAVDNPSEFAEAICQFWCDPLLLQRYWLLASQAAEQEAKRVLTFPYCCSVEKALAAYSCKYPARSLGVV